MAATHFNRQRSVMDRLMEKIGKTDSCWIWTGALSGSGYPRIRFDGRIHQASRIMWQESRGPIPSGLFACHHCDNELCVNPDHLFLGTQFDNMRDCVKKGRNVAHVHPELMPRGERHGCAKVSAQDAADIISEYRKRAPGQPSNSAQLAARFGIGADMVRLIARGKNWKHVHAAAIEKARKG